MTTSDQILKYLSVDNVRYISGEILAKNIGISRNSIWKAINSLKEQGYHIEAAVNKGYRFKQGYDPLFKVGIKIPEGLNIEVVRSLPSTNTYLKDLVSKNKASHGTVVISEQQTAGRGRMGRNFYSPEETGLYMSILLQPNISAAKAVKITTIAAVAVTKAIENVAKVHPKIKWVNDIYLYNKKICGILTEASYNMENGMLDYIICGIGINVYAPRNDFPDELKDSAGEIFTDIIPGMRNKLCSEILNTFMDMYQNLDQKTYIGSYVLRSCVIGKDITVICGNDAYPAHAVDIDENCNLIISTASGEIKKLTSGEISIIGDFT